MVITIKAIIAVIATIVSISSWAGGYVEPTPHGFHVVLFS